MEFVSGRAVKRVSVFVADGSRIHTQLLSDALQRDASLTVVSWDGNPLSLIPTVLSQHIDVLAIGSSLNGHAADALEVVRKLRAAAPGIKVVVLLHSHEDRVIIDAFRAGARGVFSRESSVEMFSKCIHSVHQGEIWADKRGVSLAIEALASTPVVRTVGTNGLNLLSKRELEVVDCLVQGLTNREIAERMGLSRHTVKNYLFRIFDKMGVSSRVELLFMTLSQGNPQGDSSIPTGSGIDSEPDAYDEPTLAFFGKAAEKGVPAAQLALAQTYLARGAKPDDFVKAYMWYLIATERMSQTQVSVTKMLTARQVDEARQKATLWLARMKQPPVSAPGAGSARIAPLRQAM